MKLQEIETFCRGEGCPQADLCRRHMEAESRTSTTYFEITPVQADGSCEAILSNGWMRDSKRCGGAHPPPRCTWQCEIELDRWHRCDGIWKWDDRKGN